MIKITRVDFTKVDYSKLDDRTLKDMAFLYHYGVWRSREEALTSVAGKAAAEQARRGRYFVHEPHLMQDDTPALTLSKGEAEDHMRKFLKDNATHLKKVDPDGS